MRTVCAVAQVASALVLRAKVEPHAVRNVITLVHAVWVQAGLLRSLCVSVNDVQVQMVHVGRAR